MSRQKRIKRKGRPPMPCKICGELKCRKETCLVQICRDRYKQNHPTTKEGLYTHKCFTMKNPISKPHFESWYTAWENNEKIYDAPPDAQCQFCKQHKRYVRNHLCATSLCEVWSKNPYLKGKIPLRIDDKDEKGLL